MHEVQVFFNKRNISIENPHFFNLIFLKYSFKHPVPGQTPITLIGLHEVPRYVCASKAEKADIMAFFLIFPVISTLL